VDPPADSATRLGNETSNAPCAELTNSTLPTPVCSGPSQVVRAVRVAIADSFASLRPDIVAKRQRAGELLQSSYLCASQLRTLLLWLVVAKERRARRSSVQAGVPLRPGRQNPQRDSGSPMCRKTNPAPISSHPSRKQPTRSPSRKSMISPAVATAPKSQSRWRIDHRTTFSCYARSANTESSLSGKRVRKVARVVLAWDTKQSMPTARSPSP